MSKPLQRHPMAKTTPVSRRCLRVITLLLLVGALGLTGCGTKTVTNTGANGQSTTQTVPNVHFAKTKFVLHMGLAFGAILMLAQLPVPNAAGVSAGHDIMIVKDLDGANKFWSALGGEPAQLGTGLKLTKLPGVLYLMRKGDNKGGTDTTTAKIQ